MVWFGNFQVHQCIFNTTHKMEAIVTHLGDKLWVWASGREGGQNLWAGVSQSLPCIALSLLPTCPVITKRCILDISICLYPQLRWHGVKLYICDGESLDYESLNANQNVYAHCLNYCFGKGSGKWSCPRQACGAVCKLCSNLAKHISCMEARFSKQTEQHLQISTPLKGYHWYDVAGENFEKFYCFID